MEIFLTFISRYYIFLILVIGLVFLIKNNTFISKKKEVFTLLSVIVSFVVAVLDYLEGVTSNYPDLKWLRYLLSILCYNLKPCICYFVLNLISNNKKEKYWILIPLGINFVVYLLPLFTKVVFYFDENYDFVRGPLGFTSHLISLFYVCYIVYVTYRNSYVRKTRDGLIVLILALSVIISVLLETFDVVSHVVWPTIALVICFYYFFLYSQASKIDPLTGLFNRKSYYVYMERNVSNISSIIEIDMNGLKWINDNRGHEAGDIALQTLSNEILKSCSLQRRSVSAYRKGGDEFTILCENLSEENVLNLIDDLRTRLLKVKISAAIGYAMSKDYMTIQECEIAADKKMYVNKINYYESKKNEVLRKKVS